MREIRDEQGYAQRCSWTDPITATHSLGGLTLHAAADYVRTFAEAFAAESAPTYGHFVLARSALESSVISWWLSEAGIARDERVKRGLSEFLYSATEVGRLKLQADSAEQVKKWTARAAKLGWAATDYEGKQWKPRSRGKPAVDGVGRPSIPDGIARLVVSNEESGIGKLLWSSLSAVSHVTWLGLLAALVPDERTPSLTPGLAAVGVGTQSSAVRLQAFCIITALRQAASARFALMGWEDHEWKTACDLAEKHELALFRAYQAGLHAATDEQAERQAPASELK